MSAFVTKAGWMVKEGGNWKNWKRRYFRLKERALAYYTNEKDLTTQGVYLLDDCKVEESDDVTGKKNSFQIVPPKQNRRYFRVYCESEKDRKEWMFAIKHNIDFKPAATKEEKKQSEVEVAVKKAADMQTELEALKKDKAQALALKDQAEKACIQKDDQIKKLDAALKQTKADYQALQEEAAFVKKQILNLQVAAQADAAKNSTATAAAAATGGGAGGGDNSALKTENDELRAEVEKARTYIKKLEDELLKAQQKRKILMAEIKRVQGMMGAAAGGGAAASPAAAAE